MSGPPNIYSPSSFTSSFEQLVRPPIEGMRTVMPSFILGATGRVWKFPSTVQIDADENPTYGRPMLQMFPGKVEVQTATVEFLQRYAPQLMGRLKDVIVSRNTDDERPREIVEWATKTADSRTKQEFDVAQRLDASAPRHIKVPTIGRDHWAFERHYNVGNGINYPVSESERIKMCESEVASDIGAIKHYIRKYADLAREYSGAHLVEATKAPQFRDPYETCMEICLLELKLPGHFITMIHYGIGLTWLTDISPAMLRSKKVFGGQKTPEEIQRDRIAHETSMEAFNTIVKMYLEDFSG